MTPLEAVLLSAVIGLPFHLLVTWQMSRLEDPAYLRQEGVVILREDALQEHTAEVGRYRDRPIWASVTFLGMCYRFDRVVPRSYRWSISERELFLEPGLVYITE